MALADELARDLPGLPIELGRVRVDEEGFHHAAATFRRSLNLPWRDVTAISWGGELKVEGRRADGLTRKLPRVRVPREAALGIETAWQEYVLRVVDRDGVLRGTASPLAAAWIDYGLGLAVVAIPGLCLCIGGVFAAHMSSGSLTLTIASMLLMVFGACMLVIGGLILHEEHSVRRDLTDWELGPEGLKVGPRGAEILLDPSGGIVLGGKMARIGRRAVCLGRMSHLLVLGRIMFALADRGEGVTVSRSLAYPLFGAITWLSMCSAATVAAWGTRGWPAGSFVSLVFAVSTAIIAVIKVRQRIRLPALMRDAIADGRAMLERLGW